MSLKHVSLTLVLLAVVLFACALAAVAFFWPASARSMNDPQVHVLGVVAGPADSSVVPTTPPTRTPPPIPRRIESPSPAPTSLPAPEPSEPDPVEARGRVSLPNEAPTYFSPEAKGYLDSALDILQQNSVRRDQVDWSNVRQKALDLATGAKTMADTYNAIQYAVTQLNDHHSRFYPPDRAAALKNLKVSDNVPPSAALLPGRVAYLSMPGFVTFDDNQRHLYADQFQDLLKKTDAQNPCGWILDLRQNTGGNIWPMFAGIGPLVGEGAMGAFVYPDGARQTWTYQSGQALLDDQILETVDGGGYVLKSGAPPVALLIGPKTQSAGEAVVIAFHGRPGARSFGQPTGGLTTANSTFDLSDGAEIVLTVVTDADRDGHTYGGILQPDQLVPTGANGADATKQAAQEWLAQQPACKTR